MTRLPYKDGEPLIRQLEEAFEAGDGDFIDANIDRLRALVARLQDRQYELAQLQYRARTILVKHEPAGDRRRLDDPTLERLIEGIEDAIRPERRDPPVA